MMAIGRVMGVGIILGLLSCADGEASQQGARDQATVAACDKVAMCGGIGEGKTYATRESCEIAQRADWEARWPPAECDERINEAELSICLQAIGILECGNLLDLINVYASKCPKMKICSGT